MPSTVIAVHTDEQLRAAARSGLEYAGHDVLEAPEVDAAWRTHAKPDLLLLPWHGVKAVRDVLTRLREHEGTRQTRTIVWAQQADMLDAVNALDLGADDCLGIPFANVELIARVNACLRRPAAVVRPDRLAAGPLTLDKAVHSVQVNGELIDLAPTEFRLMAFFLENQGRVFSREELLRRAWSRNIKAGHRTVDVHVRRLRQLLEPFGCEDMIQTVRGFGYRFAASSRDWPAQIPEPHLPARPDLP